MDSSGGTVSAWIIGGTEARKSLEAALSKS